MIWIVLWILMGVVSAVIASNKGNNGCVAFVLGVMLGPFGLLISAVTSENKSEMRKRSGDTKKCPYCAEYVKAEALVCKHCGRKLNDNTFDIDTFRKG